jgi:hypothetical protein
VQTFFLEWPSLPDDFRNLTRVPTPNLQIVKALSLFGRVQQLFAEEFHKKGIAFSASVVTENLEITANLTSPGRRPRASAHHLTMKAIGNGFALPLFIC